MTVILPGHEGEGGESPFLESMRSSMYGGAIGDALGFPHEFSRETDGGQENVLSLRQGMSVSDDTQLSCAVADATARVSAKARDGGVSAQEIARLFKHEFIAWRRDSETPDGAPGRTCLTATSRLAEGVPLPEATQWGSKGNGAIMRSHPVGFLEAGVPDSRLRARVALISGALTHSHPSSVVACLVWVEVISAVARGTDTSRLTPVAEAVLDSCLHGWRGELLAQWSEYQRPVDDDAEGAEVNNLIGDPRKWAEYGVKECREALERSVVLLEDYLGDDPCETFGDGWIAPEALALAMSMASFYSGDPWAGTERTARSRGDSDTIGSMVGSLMGASVDVAYWDDLPDRIPPRWSGKIRTIQM
ncbi:ADP-ribosyl-[dinitrogen reductase] glycohydrolase-like [Tenebrio molitor]|uniref:ADP-ribosyl-[dinitrogen reductase] glycohydrolase-like n=1 Tax=Tenebrio molitor TaxID=7067 RepID=UPI003624A339